MSSRKSEAKQLRRAVKYVIEKVDIDDMVKIYSTIAKLSLRNRSMICFNCPACKGFCENHLGTTCEQALHNWAWNNNSGYGGEKRVEALEQEPCEDAISRKEAILQIQKYGVGCFDSDEFSPEQCERFVINRLNSLPSVITEKTGRWIDDKCSVCGKGTEDLISSPEWYRNEEPYFCPFCGAKLVELQESEEV